MCLRSCSDVEAERELDVVQLQCGQPAARCAIDWRPPGGEEATFAQVCPDDYVVGACEGNFGMQRTLELLRDQVDRVHWYSLFDLPPSWPAETRHKEAEGSSYYRHYYLGLVRSDGGQKLAEMHFPTDGSVGLCQWFHFQDPRLDDAVTWMTDHNVEYLRTGVSWADSFRPAATEWFDRQMKALAPFRVALTLFFTPAHLGLTEHHTSPPKNNEQFAEFAGWVVSRYACEPRLDGVASHSQTTRCEMI